MGRRANNSPHFYLLQPVSLLCSTDGISLYNSSKVAVCTWPVINEFTKEYNISSQSSKFDISVGKKKKLWNGDWKSS